jgi:hypothetical protein
MRARNCREQFLISGMRPAAACPQIDERPAGHFSRALFHEMVELDLL